MVFFACFSKPVFLAKEFLRIPRPVPAGETFVSMRIGDYQKQSRQLIAFNNQHESTVVGCFQK